MMYSKYFPFGTLCVMLSIFFCVPQIYSQTEVELNPQGIVVPRLDTNAVSSPAEGQLVYSPTTDCYWFRNSTKWQKISRTDQIIDEDGDTRIELNEGVQDALRFYIDNAEIASFLGDGDRRRLDFRSFSTIIGRNAGVNNAAIYNTFLGQESGFQNSTGFANTFLGRYSGRATTIGSFNVFMGNGVGQENISGDSSVVIGSFASALDTQIHNSVYIGAEAGFGGENFQSPNVNRSGNVFIGHRAGKLETGSNRLFIENSAADSSKALIYGKFDENTITFNGHVGIGTAEPDEAFHIVESVVNGATNTIHENSAPASTDNRVQICHYSKTNDGISREIFLLNSTMNDVTAGSHKSRVQFATQDNGALKNAMTLNGHALGIGVDDPTAQLHSNGTVRFAGLGEGTVMTDSQGNLGVSSDIRLKEVSDEFSRGLNSVLGPILRQVMFL